MKSRIFISMLLVMSLFAVSAAAADTLYRPFVLASVSEGTLEGNTEATIKALEAPALKLSASTLRLMALILSW